MLAPIRQTTCRALPRLFPRHARQLTTEPISGQQEAMDILGFGNAAPADVAAVQPIAKPPVDLDTMHHHIPPAQSPLLQFLTTMVMRHGKYAQAAKTTSNMLLHIHALTRSAPMPIVQEAILMASPAVRCRRQKKGGGKTVYVPQALSERQRTRLGIKWIIDRADAKGLPGKTLAERLARQMIAAVKGDEGLQTLKKDMHKQAMVNRGALPKR